MPGQALALQGFPGIVYVKRGRTQAQAGNRNLSRARPGAGDLMRSFVVFSEDFR